MISHICDRCGDQIKGNPFVIEVFMNAPSGWKAHQTYHLHPGVCAGTIDVDLPRFIGKRGGGQTDPEP